ncbi:MAG: peptide ABC transporter substrate-binding protein [Dermatophilaceae bacterium]
MSAVALLAAGCSGGGDETDSGSAGRTGGEITVRGCNPQNPLVPSNTTETCGGNVIDAIFSKLVRYDPETAEPQNDIAESIATNDNQTFTIKLKAGRKFHDGTEIKAKNFVDAWNYAAYGPNAQSSGYFMEPITGYADTQCAGADPEDPCKGYTPKAKTLTGLTVVDDTTFTVKTTQKVANFAVRVGYSAFSPLPDAFFADPKAFGQKPIGSGPYKFDSWTKEQAIVLSKFPDYSGDFAGKVDKITFKIYQNADAAYNDVVGNNLDITDEVPSAALIDAKYKTDLPNRNAEDEVGVIQMINFPPTKVDPAYTDPKVRKAISMAIDRETIVKQIFNNARVPATGWVSPVVDGYKADACGEFCRYDKAKAKALLDEAGGFPGTITLSYNDDAGHKAWAEAACNSIKDALGVKCQATSVVDFATFRTQIADRKMKGMFRTAWQMDYPSIENFLAPIYATGASSNDGDYSNPAFDKLLQEAAAEPDQAASNAKYQQAEALLQNDFPVIPLWYTRITFGWSDRVTNVKPTAFGTMDFTTITLK